MDLDCQPGPVGGPGHDFPDRRGAQGPSQCRDKQIGALRRVADQLTDCSQLGPTHVVDSRERPLRPPNMDEAPFQVELVAPQPDQLSDPEPMPDVDQFEELKRILGDRQCYLP